MVNYAKERERNKLQEIARKDKQQTTLLQGDEDE